MKIEWPLWWCISVEAQKALKIYQWLKYGYHLQIPPAPDSKIDTEIESPEEIDQLMRQPPKHKQRVV